MKEQVRIRTGGDWRWGQFGGDREESLRAKST